MPSDILSMGPSHCQSHAGGLIASMTSVFWNQDRPGYASHGASGTSNYSEDQSCTS
jgi:hypothetical protein